MADATKVVRGSGARPPAAGKGRPKGSRNKTTTLLKDQILGALDKAGGINYLLVQARENPTAFMTLVGKVLPLDVNANHSGQVVAQVVFKGLNDTPDE